MDRNEYMQKYGSFKSTLHTLNNLLSIMSVNLEVFKLSHTKTDKINCPIFQEVDKNFEAFDIAIKRASRLIKTTFKDIKRENEKKDNSHPTSISSIVELIDKLFSSSTVHMDITHSVVCEIEPDRKYLLDLDAMIDIILVLFDNSIKANASFVKIHIYEEGDCVCYKFIDDGEGMNKKQLERANMGLSNRESAGHGIGLVDVKNYCRKFNGIMEINSIKDLGTEIVLKFDKEERRII